MKSRAALQTGPGRELIVDEIDVPGPGPGQALVKLFSSGICLSQIHQIEHAREFPQVFGHEAAGVVTGVGAGVTHLREGDHAIVTWVPRTPISGRPVRVEPGVTYGGEPVIGAIYAWAEDVLIQAEYVIAIGKDHPTDVSCIVGCAVLTGAGAVKNTARVRPGDSVVVFGVGGVGLCAVQMASILGAYPVIAVDLSDEKLEFAKGFGATHGVNASEVTPIEAVHEILGEGPPNGGADFVFDAIGVRETEEQILPMTRGGGPGAENVGGMAVLIGWPVDEITVDPKNFVYHQRQFRGSQGATYPEKDFDLFLRLHREGRFPLDRLVTRRYALDEINEACEALRAGQILGRAIIEF